jgi:hypothetical protein
MRLERSGCLTQCGNVGTTQLLRIGLTDVDRTDVTGAVQHDRARIYRDPRETNERSDRRRS